jgi:putative ABC transport system permease protein
VFDIRSMHQVFEESLAARRFTMTLLVWFASVAMMLAVMGLYSVHSYTVAQRMPEMGVRLALGAKPARVVRHVLAGGLRLAGAGVLIGPVAGSAAATAMSSLLFGVKPLDPVAFVAAGTLLLAVAAAASYLPARRASQVDPLAALRSE